MVNRRNEILEEMTTNMEKLLNNITFNGINYSCLITEHAILQCYRTLWWSWEHLCTCYMSEESDSLLLCVWGSRLISEVRRGVSGPVTLQRRTAGWWNGWSLLIFLQFTHLHSVILNTVACRAQVNLLEPAGTFKKCWTLWSGKNLDIILQSPLRAECRHFLFKNIYGWNTDI